MSIKKLPVHIVIEVDFRLSRDIFKFVGNIQDVDLESLFDLFSRLGLKIYDHFDARKYIPTKEDFEK